MNADLRPAAVQRSGSLHLPIRVPQDRKHIDVRRRKLLDRIEEHLALVFAPVPAQRDIQQRVPEKLMLFRTVSGNCDTAGSEHRRDKLLLSNRTLGLRVPEPLIDFVHAVRQHSQPLSLPPLEPTPNELSEEFSGKPPDTRDHCQYPIHCCVAQLLPGVSLRHLFRTTLKQSLHNSL